MKIKKFLCLSLILIVCSTFLCGCDFNIGLTSRTISGTVTFEGVGLEDVKITDRVTIYATTDSNGNFSFQTTQNEIIIYPQKSGYIFTPAKIVVTNQENITFTCEKAEELNGKLVLSEILITPISIVSFTENNYQYENEGKQCLKINDFKFKLNDEHSFENIVNDYAEIYKETNILGNNSFEYDIVHGETNIKISYILSCFFKINNRESVAIENEKIIRVNKVIDSGSLIDNKFELFANSVNSVHNGYSYNISFVFEYVANEGV